MQRYSWAALARHALGQHRGWTPLWRKAAPRPHYRVVVIGGGGHGLATAYYLAKEHGIGDVAVLEKGAIGLGNTGRNTTIIRSNYLGDESARIYAHSLRLWEGLSAELNFNVMLSQRGVLNLAHTEGDVRGPDEFAGPLGHIQGARNIPLADLPPRLPELAAEGRPLVMVCLTDKRSAQAAAVLVADGTRHVAVLRGGMKAWRATIG